ncbi:MAG: recombination regulator RecX [Lachnospiraceae bacterium]|nr:recombination regulator RecX [Lachnospiraceae bacterium]
MIVSQILPLNKSRSRVFLDGEYAFVLYKGELNRFHIREGEDLSEESYAQIMNEVLPKRAKLRAMNMLQSKSYTEAELARKLREGGYPENIISDTLTYVASYGYTDDVRYAADYIRYHCKDRGRRRLLMELQRKGVSEDSFEKAWQECEELGLTEDEDASLRMLLQKKHYKPEQADEAMRRRIVSYLLRRGYSMDRILHAIS